METQLSFVVIRFLLCFGVVLALKTNIEKLKEYVEEGHLAELVQIQVSAQVKMFHTFHNMFFPYLALPIIFILLEFAFISWPQVWFVIFFEGVWA